MFINLMGDFKKSTFVANVYLKVFSHVYTKITDIYKFVAMLKAV